MGCLLLKESCCYLQNKQNESCMQHKLLIKCVQLVNTFITINKQVSVRVVG